MATDTNPVTTGHPGQRIVLITGATSGLGRHLAERLAARGDTVLVHGRNAERVAALAERLAAVGATARPYVADLADLAEVRRLADEVRSAESRIDVLINNAGVGPGRDGAGRELSRDGHELRFAVNYLAPVLLSRQLLPLLRRSSAGRVVNVGSAAQLEIDFDDLALERFYHGWVAYGRSKLALASFTVDLAEELTSEGIAVNCVHPANFMPTAMVNELGVAAESTVEQGAEAVEALTLATATGGYYDGTALADAHEHVRDTGRRRALREATEPALAAYTVLAAADDLPEAAERPGTTTHQPFRAYAEKILDALRQVPTRDVVVHGRQRIKASELRDSVYRTARALRALGLDRGLTLTLLGGNLPEIMIVRYAAHLVGCQVNHLNNNLTAEAQAAILRDVETHTLVFDPRFSGRAEELTALRPVEHVVSLGPGRMRSAVDLLAMAAGQSAEAFAGRARPGDVCVFNYTGGTTGRPKGIVATYEQVGGLYTDPPQGRDEVPRVLVCTPLVYSGGMLADGALLSGGLVVLHEDFDAAEVLATIERERIEYLFLLPPLMYQLVDHPDSARTDTSSLRGIVYSGCRASATRLADVVRRFGLVLVQTYGQNEAGGISVLTPQDHDLTRPDRLASAGRVLPWVEVAIRDGDGRDLPVGESGEICVRARTVMREYLKQPAETAEVLRDGWLHTGDIGFLNGEGYLTVVDRLRDMINVISDHVYPGDLEELLNSHPGVRQSAVFGVLDSENVERVHAVVVPAAGVEVEAEQLRRMVREEWGAVYEPTSITFADELPLTGAGKPDKNRLRQEAVLLQRAAT
ncbi:SDR family NAD(P)-dependent oxidoreductase [Streptomyces sp. NPDC048737]|uniref:SDR family NAD(P)-dependent oxidoreductase n=1 Tax=unclassified Streptomyces TaxID=2593676 RepID=UPI0034492E14